MDGALFFWSLIVIGVAALLFGLYALIKKAVKDALREYDEEKSETKKTY